MDREFEYDNFEQFLQESTKDFKMYSTRKVWRGIYNDLHPAKKWPSIAMTLIIVAALLFIGISNNNNINKANKIVLVNTNQSNTIAQVVAPSKSAIFQNKNIRVERNELVKLSQSNTSSYYDFAESDFIPDTKFSYSIPTKVVNPSMNLVVVKKSKSEVEEETDLLYQPNKLLPSSPNLTQALLAQNNQINTQSDLSTIDLRKKTNGLKSVPQFAISTERQNRKALIKSRFNYEAYVTPSIGYRALFKQQPDKKEDIPSIVDQSSLMVAHNLEMYHLPALNMEAGFMVNYDMGKKFKLKFGAQFNQSSYLIKATKLQKAIETNIQVLSENGQSFEFVSHPTNYGIATKTTNETTTLRNGYFEFSLPVGFSYKLKGEKKLEWNIGGTVQPTFVSNGNAYVPSADNNYYVNAPELVRNFNINTAVETTLSYKVNNSGKIFFGPQFRYQAFSNYKKKFEYNEHRYNVGVKFGIIQSID